MKISALLLCLLPALAFSQDPVSSPEPVADAPRLAYAGFHRHDGFFLSMNLGPALGGTIIKASGNDAPYDKFILRGPGVMVDLKVGGAIAPNLILSFDIVGRSINDPEGEMDGENLGNAGSDVTIADNSYGIGLTRYFMPYNLFVSGSLGMGRMVVDNGSDKNSSKWGPALHLKVGKEWWVSPNWGLGLSAGYGFVAADDKKTPGVDYNGELTSHQFYVLFNTTYN